VRTTLLLLLVAFLCIGQTPLTNDSIVKMTKAGLGEDIVISTIKAQAANYTTGADDLIALKQGGVGDKVIAAMVEKMAGAPAKPATPAPAAVPATAPALPAGGHALEVGVYYKNAGNWADLPPEVVNFKTGGVLKSIGTAGIVKGDVNGRVNGAHSRTQLKFPVEMLVYTPEGTAITEYQLLRLRDSKDAREFRTMTGGVLHVSGGATRDLVPFESKKTAPRTYEIILPPSLGSGEFGLLPPTSGDSNATSGRIGKIYSFRIIE
jgi:hypothetical protein